MTLESYGLENCLYYDCRVVIYERKMFSRNDHRSIESRALAHYLKGNYRHPKAGRLTQVDV